MNVRVLESFTDIFPSFPTIEAAHHAAMLDAEINRFRIFRIDVDMANVALVRRLRKVPLVLHLLRHFSEGLELLPGVAAVLAAIEMHRLRAGVNDALIGRIDRNPSDIAFKHPLPVASRVFGTIETVECNSGKNGFGTLPTTVHGIHDLIFEIGLKLARAAHRSPDISDAAKNDHSRLCSRIESIGFSHKSPPQLHLFLRQRFS